MGKSTPDGDSRTSLDGPPGGLGAAFDRRDTTFLRAVDALEDLLRRPPAGPNAHRLLLGGIHELQGILLRALPLRTAREAAAAQTVSLCQVVDDAASSRLGEAVTVFIAMLQREAERIGLAAGPPRPADDGQDGRLLALEADYVALPDDVTQAGAVAQRRHALARQIAEAEARTLRGVLVKLRMLERSLAGLSQARGSMSVPRQLTATAATALERIVLAEHGHRSRPSSTLLSAFSANGVDAADRLETSPRPEPAAACVEIHRQPVRHALEWQQKIVTLWRRHPTLSPAFHDELVATGLLSRCVFLSSNDGGPLRFRYIGEPTRRVFGNRWADGLIGRYHSEDEYTEFARAIGAEYQDAIESGEPVYNRLLLTGLSRPPINYRHLLLGWSTSDGRQALLALIDW
ncbi:MAG TPA: hypothetical protein VD995_01265 [Azospirillum sp.]|nr:hypothetical protein [Azospirillum sp.]